jgi:ADP-heptose:LPS heptosyltransferase
MDSTPPTAAVTLGSCPRILVVKMAGLGDLLLAVPALRALRHRYPDARIDVLTSRTAAPLFADSPLVDHIYEIEVGSRTSARGFGRAGMVGAAARDVARLRAVGYDALLLLHHLTLADGVRKHRALVRLVDARTTAGLDNGRGGFLDLRVADNGFGARHEAEYFSAVAAAFDAAGDGHPRGPTPADLGWGNLARAEHASNSPPRIALHAGSGSYSVARRWPVERFAELAVALHERHGAAIVLVGGPDEVELCERLLTLLGRPTWATVAESVVSPRAMASALAACDLFVGNDSFPMHLATAAGLPVVAVFGPSNARAWGPYAPEEPGRVAIVRRDDLACSPCFYRGHDLGTPEGCPPRPCLTELGVRPVLAAAERLLRRTRPVSLGG